MRPKLPRRYLPLLAGIAVYVLLYAAASIRYERFLVPQVFLDFLHDNAVLGVLAVGMTFVVLSGGIDLSVGAMMSMSSMVIGWLIMEAHWPAAAAIPLALLFAAAVGLAMGCIIHFVEIKPFIVTLAGMFFARGVGFMINVESINIADPQHRWLAGLSIPLGGGYELPITAVVLLLVVAGGLYVSLLTPFGRSVYALGGSEEAARLMGLPVARTKVFVYGLSGLCSGIAGAVLTFYTSSGNNTEGIGMELDAIAATVIGGTLLTGGVGSVFGTFIGTLTIGLILLVVTTYEGILSSGLTRVAIGLLLLLFVLLQRVLTRRAAA
jgi:simple sugar transport system permease protein